MNTFTTDTTRKVSAAEGKVRIEYVGELFDVEYSYRDIDYRKPLKKRRLYISTDEKFDELATWLAPTPCYEDFPYLTFTKYDGTVLTEGTAYTSKGEYPDVDRAWSKHNRAQVRGWKTVIERIEGERFRFSRHAGCSCPCSPGFVGTVAKGGDIYINVTHVGPAA
jgi:hypothetical protein